VVCYNNRCANAFSQQEVVIAFVQVCLPDIFVILFFVTFIITP